MQIVCISQVSYRSERKGKAGMDVDYLITSMYNQPTIWDIHEKKHADREFIARQWEEIGKDLNCERNPLHHFRHFTRLVDLFDVPATLNGNEHSAKGQPFITIEIPHECLSNIDSITSRISHICRKCLMVIEGRVLKISALVKR